MDDIGLCLEEEESCQRWQMMIMRGWGYNFTRVLYLVLHFCYFISQNYTLHQQNHLYKYYGYYQFSSRSGQSNHAQQSTNLLNLFPGRSPGHTTALLLLTFHMRKYFILIYNKGSNIHSQGYSSQIFCVNFVLV